MSIFLFNDKPVLSAKLVDASSGNDGIIEGTKWANASRSGILKAHYVFNIELVKPKRRNSGTKPRTELRSGIFNIRSPPGFSQLEKFSIPLCAVYMLEHIRIIYHIIPMFLEIKKA